MTHQHTVTLGGAAFQARPLTLKQLREWLPVVEAINPRLPDMKFGDATFDQLISFIGLGIGKSPAELDNLPMRIDEISEAFGVVCAAAGLVPVDVGADTSGESVASETGTPSTPSSPHTSDGAGATSTT